MNGNSTLAAHRSQGMKAAQLLFPAYLWLVLAVFLPLSAMVFFSFVTEMPFTGKPWSMTVANYAAFFTTGIYAKLLLSSLRRAVPAGELHAWYQPKLDLHSRELVGAEALVRWCAGCIRNWAGCRRRSSSRWPNRPT